MGKDNFEIFAKYFGAFGYKNQLLNLYVGLAGTMIVTEENLSFDERSYHQLVLSADFSFDNINSGIICRIPLDKSVNQQVVIGLNVGIRL